MLTAGLTPVFKARCVTRGLVLTGGCTEMERGIIGFGRSLMPAFAGGVCLVRWRGLRTRRGAELLASLAIGDDAGQ